MTAQSKIEPSLYSAMAAAFAEIEAATKNSTNPHLKNKYANLSNVIDAIKPALVKHGLFFTQRPQPSDGGVTIETVIGHGSGGEMSLGSLFVPANKNDAQGFGSALTYARRYALVTAFGVPVEDDDGHAGSQAMRPREAARAPAAAKPAGGMSDASWAKLAGLLQATNTLPGTLCDHYHVADLRKLNRAQYTDAVTRLEDRLAQRAQAETNAAAQAADPSSEFDAAAAADCPF